MGSLKELFNRIVKIHGKPPEKEFFEDWVKIMSMYGYPIVESAWFQIRVDDKWKYFDLKTWHNKCDLLYKDEQISKNRAEEAVNKPEKSFKDEQMVVWGEIVKRWTGGRITAHKWLTMGLKSGLFTPAEYDREIKRRIRLNLNGYLYNRNILRVKL